MVTARQTTGTLSSATAVTARPESVTWQHVIRAIVLVPIIGSTFAMVAWISWDWLIRGPGPIRRDIQSALAVVMEWNGAERGSPFHRQFYGVKVRDAERGTFLLSSRMIDSVVLPEKHCVRLEGATANRAEVRRMLQRAHDRFSQQPWLLERNWQLDAPNLHLSDPSAESQYCDVRLEIQRIDDVPAASVQVSLSGALDGQVIGATVKRVERNGQYVSEIDLDATHQPLPRSFFCSGSPWESALQSGSQFQGNCWIDVIDGLWKTDVVGTVGPIDLTPLSRLAIHESVSGMADVRIVKALFHHGELRSLDCMVTASGGTMTGRAMEALARALGVRVSSSVEQTANWRDRTFEFDRLSFRLATTRERLTVRPTSSDSKIIVSHREKPLLEVQIPPEEGNLAILDRLFSM